MRIRFRRISSLLPQKRAGRDLPPSSLRALMSTSSVYFRVLSHNPLTLP